MHGAFEIGLVLLLAAEERVDRRNQAPVIAGELLRAAGATAGRHDGDEIVGGDKAPDELRGGRAHETAAARVGPEIVEHDEEHAAIELLTIGGDIGLDRVCAEERRIRALDRDVHARERGNGLGLALFANLEIVLRQSADEGSLCVGDDGVDLDVVDFDLEGDGGLLRRLRDEPGQREKKNQTRHAYSLSPLQP